MTRIPVLGLFGLLLAAPAHAGAWLREDGSVFLSFGANIALGDGTQSPVNHDPSLYVEWGVSRDTTLAFNSFAGMADDSYTVEAQVIRALPLPESWGVASVSGHIALRQFETVQYDATGAETDQLDRLAGVGLAWGRGFDRGWLSAETRIMTNLADGRIEGKLDLTGGYDIAPDWAAMLQVQSGTGYADDPYAKLLPSVIYRVSDRLRLNAGVTQALTGDQGTGLFLAGWVEF